MVRATGFVRIAIDVDDVYEVLRADPQAGDREVREAGPMKHGTTIIAFVEDPDDYGIELIGGNSPGTARAFRDDI